MIDISKRFDNMSNARKIKEIVPEHTNTNTEDVLLDGKQINL